MNTAEDQAGRGAASNLEGGELSTVSTELGPTVHTAQPTQIMGTAEHLLGLLSRSRPRPPITSNTIVSRVIRLSKLRVEQGPAVAVLRLARDQRGAEQLHKQRQVIAEIASHPGLDQDWRELLPQVLAFDERQDATVSVESYRPGIDLAEVLASHPDRFEELTVAALAAIAPLHRTTERLIVVDIICSVGQWVVEPMAELARVYGRVNPHLVPRLERLEVMLGQALVGRRMAVSWTHGDYTPDNVRLAGPQGPVNRIVGWGEARGDRLALIDVYLLILTASCQAEGAHLGSIVSRRLEAGGLSDSERNALRAGHGRSDTKVSESAPIDERLAILLAWLHHAAASLRNNAALPTHDDWLDVNVTPVLDVVATWRGFDVAGRRAATRRGLG
jgi:phosphotransferase family enzyme